MAEAIGAYLITATEALFFGGEMVFTMNAINLTGQIAMATALPAHSATVTVRRKDRPEFPDRVAVP